MGDKMVAPEDARENVLLAYLTNQESIYVAKSDQNTEGTWVRSGKIMKDHFYGRLSGFMVDYLKFIYKEISG